MCACICVCVLGIVLGFLKLHMASTIMKKRREKQKSPILDDTFCTHIIYNVQRHCVYMCMCVAGIVLGFLKLHTAYANMYKNMKINT